MIHIQLFQKNEERRKEGAQGKYPDHLVETTKHSTEIRHLVNQSLTRPWIRHYFLTQMLRETGGQDEVVARDTNLIEIFKATIPLAENSFIESTMSSWRTFIDSSFRDADVPWYSGIRKMLLRDRFHVAIEQLELEAPQSNMQRAFQFHDHTRTLRKLPRIPIKLFFSLPGNEQAKLLEIVRHAVKNSPHNLDVALIAYAFFKAWGCSYEFLDLARQESRKELEEWYYWVDNDMKNLGAMKRAVGDHSTAFYIYDRALMTVEEYKEIADWFLRESEFKSAYHFYSKAKEFDTALELLQNISTKEFAELTNQRRISKGEKPLDLQGDTSHFALWFQEEMETLRGFARIRAAETYKHIAVKARQNFDRETIETKYAFGELTEDEYHRLIKQLQERKQ